MDTAAALNRFSRYLAEAEAGDLALHLPASLSILEKLGFSVIGVTCPYCPGSGTQL